MEKRVFTILAVVLLAAGGVSAQKKFYNKEFKVGFTLPVNSKLVSTGGSGAAQPPLKDLAEITLNNTGRNVYDATANVSAGLMTREACRALSAQEDKAPRKTFGSVTFNKSTMIEGGMESVHPEEFYRTYRGGVCYEIRLGVGIPKHPKRGVSDRPSFERLYAILRTMYFR